MPNKLTDFVHLQQSLNTRWKSPRSQGTQTSISKAGNIAHFSVQNIFYIITYSEDINTLTDADKNNTLLRRFAGAQVNNYNCSAKRLLQTVVLYR